MFGIIVSAINAVSYFVFSSLTLKFVLFTVMFYISSEFIRFITGCGCIPNGPQIAQAFNSIPPEVWYFLNLFGVAQGITAIFCAYAVRFLLRRIPLFG